MQLLLVIKRKYVEWTLTHLIGAFTGLIAIMEHFAECLEHIATLWLQVFNVKANF